MLGKTVYNFSCCVKTAGQKGDSVMAGDRSRQLMQRRVRKGIRPDSIAYVIVRNEQLPAGCDLMSASAFAARTPAT